jgi:hypothetical protein
MSESIKIGIIVIIGLSVVLFATWDLLFGARYISPELVYSSANNQATELLEPGSLPAITIVNDVAVVASNQSSTAEPNSTDVTNSTTPYNQAGEVNGNLEPLSPSQPSAPSQHSAPSEHSAPSQHSAPSEHSAPSQHSAPSEHSPPSQTTKQSRTASASQTSILPRQITTSGPIARGPSGLNANGELTNNGHEQTDPAIAIARNATLRLERSLKRQQRNPEQQLQIATVGTNNRKTMQSAQTSGPSLSEVAETTSVTPDPNTDKAISLTYLPNTQVTCSIPSDRVTQIDVQYRPKSYSIKGMSLIEIDRLVQSYRECGGKLAISKNDLPDSGSNPDAELYTLRQNEVKYLLTQLRVKKGDMVFPDNEPTDQ